MSRYTRGSSPELDILTERFAREVMDQQAIVNRESARSRSRLVGILGGILPKWSKRRLRSEVEEREILVDRQTQLACLENIVVIDIYSALNGDFLTAMRTGGNGGPEDIIWLKNEDGDVRASVNDEFLRPDAAHIVLSRYQGIVRGIIGIENSGEAQMSRPDFNRAINPSL